MTNTTTEEGAVNTALITDNQGYGDSNFLQYRLNTDPLLEDFELSLRGLRQITEYDENGAPVVKRIRVGQSIVNELGVQKIMMFIQNMINPHTVTGNFNDEDYKLYLSRQRIALYRYLMNIKPYIDLKETDYNGLMDAIFSFLEPFFTRPINNLERRSLVFGNYTLKSGEQNQTATVPQSSVKKKFSVF